MSILNFKTFGFVEIELGILVVIDQTIKGRHLRALIASPYICLNVLVTLVQRVLSVSVEKAY